MSHRQQHAFLATNKHWLHEIYGKIGLRWNLFKSLPLLFLYICCSKSITGLICQICDGLFVTASAGQRDNGVSSEARRHRLLSEDPHSPKSVNGSAIAPASISRPTCQTRLVAPKLGSEVNQQLFTSGAVILPGTGSAKCCRTPSLDRSLELVWYDAVTKRLSLRSFKKDVKSLGHHPTVHF